MELTERSARNAAQPAAKTAIHAYPFQSIETDASGIAGTALGMAENSTTGDLATISNAAEVWVRAARHISRPTLERLGVASGTAYFPNLERSGVFPLSARMEGPLVPGQSIRGWQGI